MSSRGEALKAWIDELGTTQADVGRQARVNKDTMSRLVNGDKGSLKTWRKVARVLGVTAEGLMMGIMPGDTCRLSERAQDRPVDLFRTDGVEFADPITLASEGAKLPYSALEHAIHGTIRDIAQEHGRPALLEIKRFVDHVCVAGLPKSHLRSGGKSDG